MSDRYSRQRVLGQIGDSGQQVIGNSHVVVMGCGALGTAYANHLARMGVGSIVLVDRDVVELSNLQRQILYDESDIGKPKAIAAATKLGSINSGISVESEVADLNCRERRADRAGRHG